MNPEKVLGMVIIFMLGSSLFSVSAHSYYGYIRESMGYHYSATPTDIKDRIKKLYLHNNEHLVEIGRVYFVVTNRTYYVYKVYDNVSGYGFLLFYDPDIGDIVGGLLYQTPPYRYLAYQFVTSYIINYNDTLLDMVDEFIDSIRSKYNKYSSSFDYMREHAIYQIMNYKIAYLDYILELGVTYIMYTVINMYTGAFFGIFDPSYSRVASIIQRGMKLDLFMTGLWYAASQAALSDIAPMINDLVLNYTVHPAAYTILSIYPSVMEDNNLVKIAYSLDIPDPPPIDMITVARLYKYSEISPISSLILSSMLYYILSSELERKGINNPIKKQRFLNNTINQYLYVYTGYLPNDITLYRQILADNHSQALQIILSKNPRSAITELNNELQRSLSKLSVSENAYIKGLLKNYIGIDPDENPEKSTMVSKIINSLATAFAQWPTAKTNYPADKIVNFIFTVYGAYSDASAIFSLLATSLRENPPNLNIKHPSMLYTGTNLLDGYTISTMGLLGSSLTYNYNYTIEYLNKAFMLKLFALLNLIEYFHIMDYIDDNYNFTSEEEALYCDLISSIRDIEYVNPNYSMLYSPYSLCTSSGHTDPKEVVDYYEGLVLANILWYTDILNNIFEQVNKYFMKLRERVLLARNRLEYRKSDILLVIDFSNSMKDYFTKGYTKIDVVRYAIEQIAYLFHNNSGMVRIGLVIFNDDIECAVPPTDNMTKLFLTPLFSSDPRRLTNITLGLAYAYNYMRNYGRKDAVKAVILLTDGSSNLNSGNIQSILSKYNSSLILAYVMGIGRGGFDFNRSLMKAISKATGGEYYEFSPTVGYSPINLSKILLSTALKLSMRSTSILSYRFVDVPAGARVSTSYTANTSLPSTIMLHWIGDINPDSINLEINGVEIPPTLVTEKHIEWDLGIPVKGNISLYIDNTGSNTSAQAVLQIIEYGFTVDYSIEHVSNNMLEVKLDITSIPRNTITIYRKGTMENTVETDSRGKASYSFKVSIPSDLPYITIPLILVDNRGYTKHISIEVPVKPFTISINSVEIRGENNYRVYYTIMPLKSIDIGNIMVKVATDNATTLLEENTSKTTSYLEFRTGAEKVMLDVTVGNYTEHLVVSLENAINTTRDKLIEGIRAKFRGQQEGTTLNEHSRGEAAETTLEHEGGETTYNPPYTPYVTAIAIGAVITVSILAVIRAKRRRGQ